VIELKPVLKKNGLFVLKSQFVISSWGGLRRAVPYAVTEQGVAVRSAPCEKVVKGSSEQLSSLFLLTKGIN
jgi:hypothetical protein